jgi:hypothetical protein
MVSKICRWDGGVCRRVSCDIILPSGEVAVCKFHGNGLGRLVRHKVKPIHVSVFSKHRLKRREVDFSGS